MKRTAILSALPGELKPLVSGWHYEKHEGVYLWRTESASGEWIAACAGAGHQAVTRALSAVERHAPVDALISTGWAGALQETCRAAGVYEISVVIDARTGERFLTEAPPDGLVLVTTSRVADAAEKKRLACTYGAALVDMEAAAVARLAAMRQIPFYCVKGISDERTARLPDLNPFLALDGHFRLLPFLVFAGLRPWYWPALIRMGENSRRAAQGIARSLLEFLDERGHIGKPNGYTNLNS